MPMNRRSQPSAASAVDLVELQEAWRARDLLDAVRIGCAHVADTASHVAVEPERIAAYAAGLPLASAARPQHDPLTHYLGHGDDTLAFFITLDSINFGSGYFPRLHKRPGMSGYFTVASSLKDAFREHGPFAADALAGLSAEDCTRVFGQDPGNRDIQELMQRFASALNALGHFLLERFDGSFVRLVEVAAGSASKLVTLLAGMLFFRDAEEYRGAQIPFFKRAQLTAADLAIALDGAGPGRFDDLDRLTIFADNLVPHVLRSDGILAYDCDLSNRIEREEDIPAGSEQEIEIRACALHAVELMVKELRQRGHPATAMQVDYLLWNRGQTPPYKARRRHRTRTVFY
jgi:hypothetical protein